MGRRSEPGVPEALPRTLRLISDELGAATLDQMWIFPPLVRGRKEWGLVAVSRLGADQHGGGSDDAAKDDGADDDKGQERTPAEAGDARTVYTAVYSAERTGKGLKIEPSLTEEGVAPQDRLSRVMDGVVRRGGGELGDPREIELRGDPQKFELLLAELEAAAEERGARGGFES